MINLLELEEECYYCRGNGRKTFESNVCPNCDGTGRVVTEIGEKLLEFIKKYRSDK